MRGGQWFIPPEDVDELFRLFEAESPAYSEDNAKSLIWRWPNIERLPLVFDFDFRHSEEVEMPNEQLIHFAKLVAEMVPESVSRTQTMGTCHSSDHSSDSFVGSSGVMS